MIFQKQLEEISRNIEDGYTITLLTGYEEDEAILCKKFIFNLIIRFVSILLNSKIRSEVIKFEVLK